MGYPGRLKRRCSDSIGLGVLKQKLNAHVIQPPCTLVVSHSTKFISSKMYVFRRYVALHYFRTLQACCRSQWPCGLKHGSRPVGCGDRGFESRSRHGCLSASFSVVLSCVGRGLTTGSSFVQGVLPSV
jgi:hypothetical protein